jgi:16S rRNA (guanine966-N2)-methyltransferase
MSERIRGALFNSLADRVVGAEVLDAFAGSGAIGFEALSRGARSVVFIERDRIAQKVIQNNIEALGCHSDATLIKASIAAWSGQNAETQFNLIVADPPYHDVQLSTVTKLFAHLKVGGTMILSHPGRGEAPSGVKGIVVVDNRSYGNASLTFFRREF